MKASDNPFPSILVDEEAAPAAPAAGQQRLFVDPADHLLKMIDSAGTVTPIGSGGGGAPAGVGDFVVWQHYGAPRDPVSGSFDFAADVIDSRGTSITPADTDTAWTDVWGAAVPKLAEGLYTASFDGEQYGDTVPSGGTPAVWTTQLGFWKPDGNRLIGNTLPSGTPLATIYGYETPAGSNDWKGAGSVTMWVPDGTHFDFDGIFLRMTTINVTLSIVKVG